MSIDTPDEYLIWSIEHTAWWRPAGWGYTTSLHEAGRYTRAEGLQIVTDANIVAVNECLVPVSAVAAPLPPLAIRVRWQVRGGHVHCRLFTVTFPGETFAKCGDLVFSVEEWPALRAQLTAAVEFVHEDAP